MNTQIARGIGKMLVALTLLSTINIDAQVESTFEVIEVVVSDTVTLGCEIPINVTIENTGTEILSSDNLELYFLVSDEDPELPAVFLFPEISYDLPPIFISPGEQIELQQKLPVQEPLFDVEESDLTKNVVIVWAGGVMVNSDETLDPIAREVDVSPSELFDASIPDVEELNFEGSIDIEELSLFFEFLPESCPGEDEIVSSELVYYGNELLIRSLSQDDTYLFWSLDGFFIRCSESTDVLGELEEIPPLLDLFLEGIEYDFVEVVSIGDNLYYRIVESEGTEDEFELFLDLNYEYDSYDLNEFFFEDFVTEFGLLSSFIEEAYGTDVEVVGFEPIDDFLVQVILSDGTVIVFDLSGNFLFDDVMGEGVYTGNLEEEEVPVALTDYLDENFPSASTIEFSFLNEFNCSIVYQAVVDGDVVVNFSTEEMTPQIETGINRLDLGLEVYPNPGSSELYVQGDMEVVNKIVISDIQGHVMIQIEDPASKKIDTGGLSTGLYIVSLYKGELVQHLPWVRK